MIAVLGGLAEVERDLLIRTRTAEGRSRGQKRGQHMGRPPKLTDAQKAEAQRRRALDPTLAELAAATMWERARFPGSWHDEDIAAVGLIPGNRLKWIPKRCRPSTLGMSGTRYGEDFSTRERIYDQFDNSKAGEAYFLKMKTATYTQPIIHQCTYFKIRVKQF